MKNYDVSDSLHRLVKEALDSGAAASLEQAEALFRNYTVHFVIDDVEVQSPPSQAALITGIALASRVFLGGVFVVGQVDVPLRIPFRNLGATLKQAIGALGAKIVSAIDPCRPVITIGGPAKKKASAFHVRTVHFGWRGGVVPADFESAYIQQRNAMPLAPMLAAALAVNEAFLFIRNEAETAGRGAVGMSLWQTGDIDWLAAPFDEPELRYLPSNLWIIGLGHLGQAFLWGLGLLPYGASELHLVLQDKDEITPSTESTSLLSYAHMAGQKKTRAMAAWAEQRGFETSICERLFDGNFKRRAEEPSVAFCGIDNALGRQALEKVGFDFIVEAGLGSGYKNFRTIRIHTLPANRSAEQIWKVSSATEDVSSREAYQKIQKEQGLDQCGITLLAGKAIGAPFVGSIAACLALAEFLKLLHGGQLSQLVEMDLSGLDFRTVVPQSRDFSTINPGYAEVDRAN